MKQSRNHETGHHTRPQHSGSHAHKELARAYIPMQQWGALFMPEDALRNGTIFKELYRPYSGGDVCRPNM